MNFRMAACSEPRNSSISRRTLVTWPSRASFGLGMDGGCVEADPSACAMHVFMRYISATEVAPSPSERK
jgi:hypothetical protein